MASVMSVIFDRRPCYVGSDYKKALFHRWADSEFPKKDGVTIRQVLGIVEYEDGVVAQVEPKSIIFADGGEFGEYVWFPLGPVKNSRSGKKHIVDIFEEEVCQ